MCFRFFVFITYVVGNDLVIVESRKADDPPADDQEFTVNIVWLLVEGRH